MFWRSITPNTTAMFLFFSLLVLMDAVTHCSFISSMDVGNLSLHLESMARSFYLMTERKWIDVDDFATDCGQETMETNLIQRSDGECRWRIGQSREMGNGYVKRTRHSSRWRHIYSCQLSHNWQAWTSPQTSHAHEPA